jgi:NADPH:quinone reductase-like Zn-dependent oxidoreductase
MIASPVNPSDILTIRGLYGVRPALPAIPGYEGVGVVDKVGGGLIGWLAKGRRVTVINSAGGNWAEFAVIPERQARPIPADIADDQAASYFVNPATAVAMVRRVLKIPRGEWLLQSAGGSELGKMLIRLCKADGIKTISIVRRREAIDPLRALGGDVVISSSDGPIPDQVRSATRGASIHYAVDPVGGDTGTQVFESLGDEARMLVYGTLSGEPIRLDPRLMIAGRRIVEGFWLGHWMRSRSIPASLALFREIAAQMRTGVLTTEVGAKFPLHSIREALLAAETPGRPGKVQLTIGERR